MNDNRDRQLQRVLAWASGREDIRVVLLTSSLVNPFAPVDRFSDLDIELVTTDLPGLLASNDWIGHFGTVMTMVAENEDAFDGLHAMRMVLYEDHTKIDFKLYSTAKFREAVLAAELQQDWDIGYQVMIDKDGLTAGMQAPSYAPAFICRPSEEKYNQVINDFWWDTTYVAKCLWRDNIFYAKFMSEDNIRSQYLLPLIEWYIGMVHHWQVSTNKKGRLFQQYLSPELWAAIEATFSGSDIKDNWRALFACTGVVRRLGRELAAGLGYRYPEQLDRQVSAYLGYVQALDKTDA